ncbi:UNVERIFIED_CONTAM: hypothetical protein RMT77_012189 [Armadillidium vulgare]
MVLPTNLEKPPDIQNNSCWGGSIQTQELMKLHPTGGDIVRVTVSLIFGVLVVVSNCIFLFALNHRGHVKHLPMQGESLEESVRERFFHRGEKCCQMNTPNT